MGPPPAIARFAGVSPARPSGLRVHILLVDDDPAVRSVTRGLLERLGHRVQTAVDGGSALECYRSSSADPFDLVLLDLNMPGMDGVEVLRALRFLDPGVRVLMMSGFLSEDLGERLSSGEALGFLQKPFTLDHLQEVVRSSLPVRGAVLPST